MVSQSALKLNLMINTLSRGLIYPYYIGIRHIYLTRSFNKIYEQCRVHLC